MSTKRGMRRGVWGAVALALLLAGWGAARATGYVYDDLGRLVQVVLPNGSGTQYVYDAAGNITAVRAVNAGTLSITSFTPESGAPGSKLTVNGSGFATSLAGNTVTVGGASATVTAATASQLTVTVPAGAVTGPVKVTTGAGSVTSAKPFTVVSSKSPTIASFTPVLGTTGTTVTLTGTNIQTTASDNRLLFNTSGLATLSAATATTLTTKVPSAGSSGRLTLSTPYGSAVSTADFLAVPDNRSASNVAAWTRIAVGGAGATLGIPAAGKHGAVIFDGSINQLVTLDTSGSTLGGALGYAVYGPQGTQLATGSVSASQPQAYLPTLTAAGTYAVFFDAGAAATLKVAAVTDQGFAVDAGRSTIKDIFPGQSASVPFTGTAGQNLGLSLSGLSFTGAGATAAVTLQVLKPDGTVWLSNASCLTSNPGAACELNLSGLPVSGTYTIKVSNPAGNRPIAAGVLTLSSDKTGTLASGQLQSVAVRTGQNGRIAFAATAGQVATVWLGNHATDPSVSIPVTVLKPDGSVAFTQTLTPDVRGDYLTVQAAQSGNYSVFIDPAYGASGTLQMVLNPAVSELTIDGAPVPQSSAPGAYAVFNGVAGQNLGLGLKGLSFPNGGTATLIVRRPDGTAIGQASCSSSSPAGGCDVNLSNLPSTGLYRVQLIPTSAQTATVNFVLSSDKVTPLIAATPATASLRAGQNGRFTVQGSAGQPMNLWVGQGVSDPASVSIAVTVLRPDGGVAGSTTLSSTGNGTAFTIPSAPATGTYTMFVDPGFGAAATVQAVSEPVATPVVVDGAAVNIAVAPGSYGKFTGTAGQNLGLSLRGLAFANGVVGSATLRAVQPNGSVWQSATCSSTNPAGSCELNLSNLPATGTYQIQLIGNTAAIASATVTLSTDLVATLPSGGAANLALRAGQNGRYTIAGSANQQLSLQFDALTTDPAAQNVPITLYTPAGTLFWQTTVNAGSAGVAMTPPLLPETGNYLLFVDPAFGASMSTTLSLGNTAVPPIAIDGAATALGGTKGLYASFTGTAGQNLGLGLSGLAFNGGASSYVYVYVSRPDGTQLVSSNACYAGASCGLNLSRLPASGRYLVRVVPGNSATVSAMNLTLSNDIGGALTAGTPRAVTLRSGQNAMLAVTGTAGQPATVRFKGLTTTPAGQSINVSLLKSDGSLMTSVAGNTSVDGGQLFVPSMPSSGSYFVFVDPDNGVPGTLSVALDPPDDVAIDGPSVNLPVPLALDTGASYKFTSAAGQTLGVGLSGMAGDGALALDVQSPAGSSVSSTTCYASYGTCGMNLTLPATGSYLIRVRLYGGTLTAGSIVLSRDVTATLAAGTPRPLSLRAGQNGRASFAGTAGQPATIRFSGITTTPTADRTVYVSLFKPDGSLLLSTSGTTSSDGNQLYVASLPASGTYTVFVDPDYGAATALTLALNPADDIAIDGAASTLSQPSPTGTVHSRKFSGVAGQTLGVGLSGMTGDGAVSFEVQSPAGTSVTSTTCYATYGSCGMNLTLPATGSYLIRARQYGGTLTAGSIVLSSDVTATLAAGTPRPLSLRAGQNGRASFAGTAGQPATIRFSGIATTPTADRTVYVSLFKPDGSLLLSTSGTTSSDGNQLYVASLPASGTYTVFVDPDYGAATALTLALNPADDIAIDGAASTLSQPSPTGTVHSRKFSGVAGQTLGVGLSGMTGDGAVSFEVQSPAGTSVTSTTCYATYGSCGMNLTLPATGSYLIRARQYGGTLTAGSIVLSSDVTATLAAGTPRPLSLRAGQNGRASFAGTAGQPATIRFSGITTTPTADRTVYVSLFKPDGSLLLSTSGTTSSDGNQLYVASLPASGTYTVFVDPDYGSAAGLSLTLNPSADLTADGPTKTLPVPVLTTTPLVLQFNGTTGQTLGLGLSGLVTSGYVALEVLNPAGNSVSSTTCYASPGACGLDLSLPTTGAYLVRIRAMGADLTGGKVTLSSDTGGALPANAPVALTLREGQNGRFTFAGTAGQPAAIRFKGVATTPAGRGVYVYLNRPDGSRLASDSGSTSTDGGLLNVASLPVTGTYTVLVDPSDGAAAQLALTLNPASDIAVDGTPVALAAMAADSARTFVFKATAGQNLGMSLSGLTGNNYVNLTVLAQSGGTLESTSCYISSGSCGLNLTNLAAGTYLVRVSVPVGVSFTGGALTLSSDRSGALTAGTPVAITLRDGQNGRFTFAGTAGQPVSIRFNGITTTPDGRSVYVYLNRPDGSRVTSDYASTANGGGLLHVASLPVTGTYTVLVDPSDGAAAQLSLALNPASDIAIDGTPVALSAIAASVAKTFVFQATAGQNLGVALSGLAGNNYVNLAVQGPSGSLVDSTSCYISSVSCGLNLPNLVAGTYLVRVSVPAGVSFTGATLTLSSDRSGALTAGTPVAITLRDGQNGRFTFAGTAGQPVSIRFNGITTTPDGRSVYVYLNRPDGSRVTSDYASTANGGGLLHVASLPVTGTYTVLVDPSDGAAAQLSLALNPASDIAIDGTPVALSAIAASAAKTFVFQATAGQNLGVALSGLAGNNYVNLAVQGPSGSLVDSTSCYISSVSCGLNLPNLVAGTYLVRVSVPAGVSFTGATLTLSSDRSGALTAGTPVAVTLRDGQNARYTFAGTQGQAATIRFSGLTTTPANRTVYVYLNRPDGSRVTSDYASPSSDGGALYVASLPVTGTYTVFVDPSDGAGGQATLALNPAPDIAVDGAALSLPAMPAGTAKTLTFQASAGQYLGVGLGGLTGGSYVGLAIQGPNGAVDSTTCYISESQCGLNVPSTAAGLYVVRVSATYALSTGALTVSRDVAAAMTVGTPYPLTLRQGQNGRLTVTVPAGARSLVVGTPSTTPSGRYVSVRVLNASGSTVASGNYSTSGGTMALGTLAAGAYTVIVDPDYGASASVTVTMQ
ncbi:IPT/TIG domain-containing protein [Roseateles chitinivorans]|uniref:IPT/TIG domain-containing protein n=1 Tax=Roseateles chitinivorans TaxID=2917965 RepID=UPI003D67ADDB